MKNVPTPDEILIAPDTSLWLKAALTSALDRDPIDAANEAELLAMVLAARANAKLATEMARLGLRSHNGTGDGLDTTPR